MQFADKAELVADLQVARDGAHAALANYTPKGGTALYDALQLSMQRLKTTEGRRVVVVVTDGRDENAASTAAGSVATWEMVIGTAQAMDATVYAIGLGSRVERGRLQQLADLTGGEAYFTNDLASLDAEYRRVDRGSPSPIRAGLHIHQWEARRRLADCRTTQRGGARALPQPWRLPCSDTVTRRARRESRTPHPSERRSPSGFWERTVDCLADTRLPAGIRGAVRTAFM